MCMIYTFRGIYYYCYFSFVENHHWIAPLRIETLQSMPSVLQLILTLGLTIGVWCCLDDHAPLTPINSHVNKQHQCLTHGSLFVLAELPYWSLRSNFNSSISYKRSKTLKVLTLAEGGWSARESNLFWLFWLVAASTLISWKEHNKMAYFQQKQVSALFLLIPKFVL